MKFTMVAALMLSENLTSLQKADVKTFLLKESVPILQKGVPEGEKGAAVVKVSVADDSILLTIESGRYVRPPDAILRIKKLVSQELGREYKIGVRKIEIHRYNVEKYPLKNVSPKYFSQSGELPFIKYSINTDGSEADIEFWGLDEAGFLEKKYADRALKEFENKIGVGKSDFAKTINKSEPRLDKYKLKEDPTTTLEKNNWVKHVASGVWTILPPYAALWRAIENLVLEKIARPLGFNEVMLPKIVPLEIQRKKGQLFGIPNEMWWVCPPKTRDPIEWEEYKIEVKSTGNTLPKKLMENLSEPEFSLAYAQCEPFYDIWAGRTVDRDRLPLKFVDNYGPTWRYESGGLKGLERLSEFKRMEFVWIGSPEDAIEIRDSVRDRALEIVDKIFDIEWRVDATTAIYLEHAGESMDKEDRDYVRTYDLTVALPFETASRPEQELEIASFHVHEDHYARNFYWKEKKNRPLWSGCAGISPTRWAYVFLLRHGFEYSNWPKSIRRYIGETLPELPENLFL